MVYSLKNNIKERDTIHNTINMSFRSTLGNSGDPWFLLFERFNRTIKKETDTLFKHIMDSQTNLINERDSLRKEIELLKQERDQMTRILRTYDQMVTLNVGGQLFSTTGDTLKKEECLFTKLLSGRYNPPEQEGAVFIDRDPTHFRSV